MRRQRQRQRGQPLTAAQVEALHFIARQHAQDLAGLVRGHGLAERVEELTVGQVDHVVSLLKSGSMPSTGREEACQDGS